MLRLDSSIGAKKLQMGGGGKNDILIMVGLGAIIIFALGLAGYGIFGGGPGSKVEAIELRYECQACRHQWAPDKGEFEDEEEAMAMSDPAFYRATCPKCSKKEGAQMTQCPACKHFFVSQATLDPEIMMSGEPFDNICPNSECGIDITQYYRDKYQKKRGKK